MPVRRNVALNLNMEQILRRQEIRDPTKIRPGLMAVLEELLASIHDLHLLEPAVAYEFYDVTELHQHQFFLHGNKSTASFTIPPVLSRAVELAVVLCTIGPRLEERVTHYSKDREPLRALMLDGIGSAAVDALAQEACNLVSLEAGSLGHMASSPLSPGMPELPIANQQLVFQLLPADEIGVRLTDRYVMVPLKSISMVIGLGTEMPTWTQAEVCARCSLNQNCLHRMHYARKSGQSKNKTK